ncbi:hypothetical protein HOLleu_03935 [Holothuria leucospilota]|uniref:C2H2-type domain-containing protein n=1 Tax=Holothuria leucospilota TaxID=206669 RepID=A0A9Q1CTZ8_HOLLE|nr:hypothetical protein HOLleu_03935 [Holothuria leucospilota]
MRYRNVDIPLQCSVTFYRQICSDMRDFMKHLKEHIVVGTAISCPFNNCYASFSNKSTFSSHLSRNHKPDATDQISAHLVQLKVPVYKDNLENNNGVIVDDEVVDELELLHGTDNAQDFYFQNLMFYLKLESKYLLPASTIQHIIEQFKDIQSWSDQDFKKLFASLTDDLEIPEQRAKQLVEEVGASDLLVASSDGPLRSDYIRKPITNPSSIMLPQLKLN